MPGEPFDAILPEEGDLSNYLEDIPVFRDDGLSVAYRACRGQSEYIVCDGEAGEPFGFVSGGPAFSPNNGHLVYAAGESLKGTSSSTIIEVNLSIGSGPVRRNRACR